ncbi:MAG TPA: RNA-binding cell elongation regulator Jag/EloR [Candidatus Saccharimonadales bacterium]|nr:RNA-binding cell elongation regulator Jag/EloR [Candidatus Saccharimonadales bacterium]
MSAYREFTGKSVEEALRNAREAFGAGLDDLDFEILTPGSRGVLGMGAEPARIVAAPRSALGGAVPKREAAASTPLPPPPPREDRGPRRDFGDRGPRPAGGGFREDRGPRRDFGDRGPRPAAPDREFGQDRHAAADRGGAPDRAPAADRGPASERGEQPERGRPEDRGPRRDHGDRPAAAASVSPPETGQGPRPSRGAAPVGRPDRGPQRSSKGRGDPLEGGPARGDRPARLAPARSDLSASEMAELTAARGSLSGERAELEASDASPEALKAGQQILEELMRHLGFAVRVEVESGETSRLNVVGEGDEKEALGALIGRKGERLSALQHLVNLMLSRRMDTWTRVLVDVEDYRGRRERQLRELATRAAERVGETGKMLQLEPMPALERRWIHIALRDHPSVTTQSIGEEPNRRVVVVPRSV